MPITIPCPCGAALRAPDTAVGKQVRCPRCKTVHTVPAPRPAPLPAPPARPGTPPRVQLTPIPTASPLPPVRPAPPPPPPPPADDLPPTPRRPRRVEEDEEEDRPRRDEDRRPRRRDEGEEDVPRKRTKPKAGKKLGGSFDDPEKRMRLYLLLGVAGVVLLGCLGLGGFGLYYWLGGSAGPAAEDQLVGDWETDPEAYKEEAAKNPLGVNLVLGAKLTFNKDHTYRLVLLLEMTGRWEVVSRDGNTLRVKMVGQIFGMDQDRPPTATIRFRDKDHIEFDADDPSMTTHMKLRRVGTGPPLPQSATELAPGGAGQPPQPAPPAGGGTWQNVTLENLVSLDVPGPAARSRNGVTPHSGEMLRWVEYSAAPPIGPEVKIRLYRNVRQPRGRSAAEYIGATYMADGPARPERTFELDGKPAAVFTQRWGKDPGIWLAVGDEAGVCVVFLAGASLTEQDPMAQRVFASIRFLR